MIIHVHPGGTDAAAVLADSLGRPLSSDEGLTSDAGGSVVAHWKQLDWYTDEERIWTTPEWAQHLADPLLQHPFAAGPDGSRRAIFHLSVRLHPLDRNLSPAEWSEIAHRLARTAGLAPPGDDPAACRWIAIQEQAFRMDLIGNLIRSDGAWASTPGRLAQAVEGEARRIESDLLLYNHRPPAGEKQAGFAAPSPPFAPPAASALAGILNQLAAEQNSPLATVRQLIEQLSREAAALPAHETAAAGRDLFWAARRLHGVQDQLGQIAARLAPASSVLAPHPVPGPVPVTPGAVTR
ncbi:relaxase/mobilization nuclease [Streptomyces sp. NPDC048718]|uniref:relaxase/mobilization nuclease n=1 Tax=Streptomyces sp. NPDC048718 TaxID=3365587 RepID=UPI0037224CE9